MAAEVTLNCSHLNPDLLVEWISGPSFPTQTLPSHTIFSTHGVQQGVCNKPTLHTETNYPLQATSGSSIPGVHLHHMVCLMDQRSQSTLAIPQRMRRMYGQSSVNHQLNSIEKMSDFINVRP